MATNHTTNYALNLWEPTDAFLREEFNENTQKIEAALNTKTSVVTGTYGGTAASGTTATRQITLGFRPKAVIAWAPSIVGNMQSCGMYIAAAVDGAPYAENGHTVLEITDTGFKATTIFGYSGYDYPTMNNSEQTYRYIAFR